MENPMRIIPLTITLAVALTAGIANAQDITPSFNCPLNDTGTVTEIGLHYNTLMHNLDSVQASFVELGAVCHHGSPDDVLVVYLPMAEGGHYVFDPRNFGDLNAVEELARFLIENGEHLGRNPRDGS